MTSPRLTARLAGLCYLFVFIGGPFATFFARSGMVVRDDATATASHIMAAETWYRFSIAGDLLTTVAYIGVTALLYELLKPASRTLSTLAAFFSLIGLAVSAVNALNLLTPLVFLSNAHYLQSLSSDQLNTLALAALKLQSQAGIVPIVFFGFYCFFIGWLVLRARFLPRFVGVLMIIAGMAWLFDSFAAILWPVFTVKIFPYSLLPGIVGEGALTLWLIFRGVDETRWREQAAMGRT